MTVFTVRVSVSHAQRSYAGRRRCGSVAGAARKGSSPADWLRSNANPFRKCAPRIRTDRASPGAATRRAVKPAAERVSVIGHHERRE